MAHNNISVFRSYLTCLYTQNVLMWCLVLNRARTYNDILYSVTCTCMYTCTCRVLMVFYVQAESPLTSQVFSEIRYSMYYNAVDLLSVTSALILNWYIFLDMKIIIILLNFKLLKLAVHCIVLQQWPYWCSLHYSYEWNIYNFCLQPAMLWIFKIFWYYHYLYTV